MYIYIAVSLYHTSVCIYIQRLGSAPHLQWMDQSSPTNARVTITNQKFPMVLYYQS